MSPVVTLLLFAASAQAAAEAPPPGDEVRRRPAIAPVAAVKYTVKVQADAALPKGERPDATAGAGDGRLSVAIQPEAKSFAGNGPVGVTVTLKNVSEKAFRLYGAEKLGKRPELVMVHQKTGAQTRMTGNWDADLTQAPVVLEPGKSYVRTFAIVQEGGVVVPGQIPLPRPVPFPGPKPGLPIERNREAAAPPAPPDGKPPAEKIAPGFPLIAAPARTVLSPEGTVRIRLMLEFTAPEGAKPEAPAWSGKVASEPIDVEFGPPVWKGVPVPPFGGPVTKQQAITLAQQAAEAALTSAYNPQDPVRPPKEGAWIGDPPKTATVKERPNNAGWTVSWTHTQKGKGHSYHAVIDVAANGQTTVREVFAGYSNR